MTCNECFLFEIWKKLQWNCQVRIVSVHLCFIHNSITHFNWQFSSIYSLTLAKSALPFGPFNEHWSNWTAIISVESSTTFEAHLFGMNGILFHNIRKIVERNVFLNQNLLRQFVGSPEIFRGAFYII